MGFAALEEQKKNANDDEIAVINKKIDNLVAEWIFWIVGIWYMLDFKIELDQATSWKDILQEAVPKCFNNYFNSRSDLKNYFDITKLRVFSEYVWNPFYDRWMIHYNYNNWQTEETKVPAYIKIIGSIID